MVAKIPIFGETRFDRLIWGNQGLIETCQKCTPLWGGHR